MDKYGFIITRHVNSEITNRYWNQNVKLIRTFYPLRQIVIIDDNSKPEFIKEFFPYKNVEYVVSEFPQRGEILPFYYYIKNKYQESQAAEVVFKIVNFVIMQQIGKTLIGGPPKIFFVK